MEEIRYFDNAATTKVKDEVIKTMIPYFGIEFGNPSSMYKIGRSAKRAIEDARKKVAELINCNASEIIFTAGGSESDNTALKGIAHLAKNKGKHIITSKIEHYAVLNSCKELEKEGYSVEVIDMFTIKPLDEKLLIKEAKGKSKIVTIENHSIYGGLGSAVSEVIAENGISVPVKRIGVKEKFGQVGTAEFLQEEFGLTAKQIKETICQF